MWVGRRLDECDVAATEQRVRDQRDRMLPADRHHDLVCGRGQAAIGVALGDGLAEREVADQIESRPVERVDHALAHPGEDVTETIDRRGHRAREVDCPGIRFILSGAGKDRTAPGPLPAHQVAGVADELVARDDRRAAAPGCGGEFAFGGKPGAHRDAAVEDQQSDPFGEGLVDRASGVELADEVHQGPSRHPCADGRVRHESS